MVVQLLALFLTLDLSGTPGPRLREHPEWKQALTDEPIFRGFALARSMPAPSKSSLKAPASGSQNASPSSTNASLVSMGTLAGLSASFAKGMWSVGKKLQTSMGSTRTFEPTGDPDTDSALSAAAHFADKAHK